MAKQKLSVVLATRNEEANLAACLRSVRGLADEIIVVDEHSVDRTPEIARSFGAKVYAVEHEDIFHKTKQKALDKASGDWILQLDADERVTPGLAHEIRSVINHPEAVRKLPSAKQKLFFRHQRLIEARDGKVGTGAGATVAFFLPRRNIFLGKPLIHAGVYPDANIRLVKRDKARFPAKSVHEQMVIDGKVGWLTHDLEHHDSPTLRRYLDRANRYTNLTADEFAGAQKAKSAFNLLFYSTLKPLGVFLNLYLRHKGFLDGIRGFLWSAFSALHFPLAYWKYFVRSQGK